MAFKVSSNSNASSNHNGSSGTMPNTRRRRESSEDFPGSLGSIGGSAVGSSVEEVSATVARKPQQPVAPSVPLPAQSTAAVGKKPVDTFEVNSTASGGSGVTNTVPSPPPGRRPPRKRKGSFDFRLSLDETTSSASIQPTKLLPSSDALPSVDVGPSMDEAASILLRRPRGYSVSSAILPPPNGSETKEDLKIAASATGDAKANGEGRLRKGSLHSENSSSHGTYTSQSHRMLIESFLGDGAESLVDSKCAEKAETMELRRERENSFEVKDRLGSFDVRDRLGSFDFRERLGSFEATRRDRLESLGNMSDLSMDPGTESLLGGAATAAALAATFTSNPLVGPTASGSKNGEEESISGFLNSDSKIPSKISLQQRGRKDSNLSNTTDGSDPVVAETAFPNEIQSYVRAAVASVGDQLAAIAAATEATRAGDEPSVSSTSLHIGAASDIESKTGSASSRLRSASMSSAAKSFSMDSGVLAAALNAGEAAAGAINLSTIASTASSKDSSIKRKINLPLHSGKGDSQSVTSESSKKPQDEYPPIPKSTVNEKELENMHERARVAAGYVPPPQHETSRPSLPPKKRPKHEYTYKPRAVLDQTPKTSNTSSRPRVDPPLPVLSSTTRSPVTKGQSSQKWDVMYKCLLEFVEERRLEENAGKPASCKEKWIWDGNVPTTFVSKDGKPLGRWVNNQRTAKSKGNLKDDREQRLVQAGLKWSVLTSNSWKEMLEELRLYIADHTKSGRQWDGNVPTNYRIKSKSTHGQKDEAKNLGRWVNRQRSLYQSKKLRKDRQQALESVGLKWSMLATTSWESMYDTLCEYVATRTKDSTEWDGNVPANFKTNDDPPRALGRWINRQRSAYTKKKLKAESIDKLTKIGLKWAVHERRGMVAPEETLSGVPDASLSNSVVALDSVVLSGPGADAENDDEIAIPDVALSMDDGKETALVGIKTAS